ncbi:hypothetical protein DOJK_00279 [Patescibacteria group bacterium]|nr:hypothetical protein DOJK_00279 [Patescibacteria group bacterium]
MFKSVFKLDRTFCQRNMQTGLMEWFFYAREGVFGPYSSKEITKKELKEFIERRMALGDDGGRSNIKKTNNKPSLSLVSLHQENNNLEYSKRKKGLDGY